MDKTALEIVIVAGGMAFGPNTLQHKSLGGSETAVIGIASELKKRGHIVTVFCPLPQPGQPDYWESGAVDEDGVRYVNIDHYQKFIVATEVDLLVASRTPELLGLPHQAKKAVLWCHDLATYNGPLQTLQATSWNFDEIWCVSEWHRQQYHKISGYPLERIVATRNGIMRYEIPEWIERVPNQLVYAARPERGLINLVRPGGIMSRLPDFNLKVTMYDNFPPHMHEFYNQLFGWAQRLPNVEIIPPMKQGDLRQLIAQSAAYVYPTDFEETSCMLARECVSVGTLMVTTDRGALRETLDHCGLIVNVNGEIGSDEWCENFAAVIRDSVPGGVPRTVQENMMARDDLYWDGVAEQWESLAYHIEAGSTYSRVRSLVEDSDIIPAIALVDKVLETSQPDWAVRMQKELEDLYPYLFGRESLASYYERYFLREDTKGARERRSSTGNPRFEAIAEQIASLHTGACVLDYGCAEGVIILDLAQRNPDKKFVGFDHAQTNVDLCEKYAREMGLTNVEFCVAESPNDIPLKHADADAAICSEVLEHVAEPWVLISDLERNVKVGGRIIITVPQGPWEAIGLYDPEQWPWRAHIWHINKWMLRQMFKDKADCQMMSLFSGHQDDGRMLGHLIFSYTSDNNHAYKIDPLEKADQARIRQSCAACVIVKNGEDSILKMLKSIDRQVSQIVIGLSEGNTDFTDGLIFNFQKNRPWLDVRVVTLPDITPGLFGFDDARNALLEHIDTDWFLWIDADEYLSGNFQRYLRSNVFDSYSIHQHHFTCDPRGMPAQLDKPARLCRTDRGFKFYGKVHEHAEKGFNGGPGFSFVLGDVDIGHTGYINESVRRGRFGRNFPLLQWDREVFPERKLGKYLWLRDMIHQMRYGVEQQDMNAARRFAEDAIAFYRENWMSWDEAGMGGMNAHQYYSEALAFLGRGLPATIQIQLGDQTLAAQGIFESQEEISQMIEVALKPRFDQRKSGYWQ